MIYMVSLLPPSVPKSLPLKPRASPPQSFSNRHHCLFQLLQLKQALIWTSTRPKSDRNTNFFTLFSLKGDYRIWWSVPRLMACCVIWKQEDWIYFTPKKTTTNSTFYLETWYWDSRYTIYSKINFWCCTCTSLVVLVLWTFFLQLQKTFCV